MRSEKEIRERLDSHKKNIEMGLYASERLKYIRARNELEWVLGD